ncbi:hypothetical protein [Bacillus cereus]|uniref:Phr family secreted Rap phosphatase inhibitor n=1 Tax=Bacillus cereus TaxID=1396 RepID=A0A2B9ECB4_BACCE|nr:hypothetical protein [Bacillus cereus]PGM97356.1 hypothetical protein CN958_02725 [Bacillus cereus]
MKRKISTAVVGLSVLGFGMFGINIGDGGVVKAEHGDVPAPKLENHGDYGGAPAFNKGDTWAPTYDHGRPPVSKQDSHADLPAPKLENHGEHI